MSVHCATCGEQLLGSVNRCWKCGNEFEALTEGDLPPVVRGPALLAEDHAEANVPVAELVATHGDRAPTNNRNVPRTVTTGGSWGLGFAVSSIVIGGFALVTSFFTPFAAIGALVGIALGVLALVSGNRGIAIAGILLCCLAIMVSGIRLSLAAGNYLTTPAEELEDSF